VISQTPTTQKGNGYGIGRGHSAIGGDPLLFIPRWNNIIGPLPIFGSNVSGVGMAATTPEIDGVVRRIPMLVGINSSIFPSITLETIRVAVGSPSYQIKSTEAGVEAVRVRGFKPMTTDSNGRIWLNWNYKFKKISYTDLDKVNLKGKIVVFGLEVEGVGGIIATPLGPKWSHELQAMGIESAIQGKTPVRFAFANLIEAISILLIGVFMILLIPVFGPVVTYVFYPIFVGASVYGSYFTFSKYGQLWDVSFLILSFTIIFGYMVILKFLKELFLKLQIKKQFGTYLSPALVEKLQKNPDLIKLGGETRDLSIMFTDVRGFTAIS
jgi:adenylate cyclase